MSYNLFLILIIIVALLLILIVMVQNPKGGGLSSSFGGQGGQSMGGVQSTTNFLDRSTWTLAIALFALILLSNFTMPKKDVTGDKSTIDNKIDNRVIKEEVPAVPAPASNEDEAPVSSDEKE